MNTFNNISTVNTLSVEALFTIAATSYDEDQVWAAIERLRSIGTEAIYTQAVAFCHSETARERRVGVDVLAQWGLPQPTYHEPVVQLLLTVLETEQSPEVIASIAIALGHRNDARAVAALLPFQTHPDPEVRYGVAIGLLTHPDPRAVACLIALSADPEPHIRDWATFGLAVQIDTDTPEIRAALAARLSDPDGDTAGEAMVGLARRNDPRVIAPLLELLREDDGGSLPLEAAAALGDPVLLPALHAIQASWSGAHDWPYSLLEEAIAACTP